MFQTSEHHTKVKDNISKRFGNIFPCPCQPAWLHLLCVQSSSLVLELSFQRPSHSSSARSLELTFMFKPSSHPLPSNACIAPAPWGAQTKSRQVVFPTRPPPTMATLFPCVLLDSIAVTAFWQRALSTAVPGEAGVSSDPAACSLLPRGRRMERMWVAASCLGSFPS